MKILAINPGSTSTKIAVFEDTKMLFEKTIKHKVEDLAPYETIIDQYDFRKDFILSAMNDEGITLKEIDAVVGRGGLLKPIPGGVYKVCKAMIEDLKDSPLGEHASNLGGILAREISMECTLDRDCGKEIGAYIVDPVVVDEMSDMARLSGHPELPRISIFHALNQKAVARRYARDINKKYEDINLIVVHLGGGITVGAHEKGKVVDVNNGLDGDGPYSPERSGGLPSGQMAKLCYSRKYQLHEVKQMIKGKGGLVAYLGTNDAYEVELNALDGDADSMKYFQGIGYQVSKEIGSCSAVLKGDVDAIILTGGIARSEPLTEWISERVSFIAPVKIYPGEDEMRALAESVYYALNGEQEIRNYLPNCKD